MNDPYHVYFDLDVINRDYDATIKPHLRFEEARNLPFLPGDLADYFCSIVRFNIQTGNTLPVFIPRIELEQGNINKTIYQVGILMDHDTDPITANDPVTANPNLEKIGLASITYEPEDEVCLKPLKPSQEQDLSGTYYYVYHYQHFVKLVNKAIKIAFADLKAKYINTGPGSTSTINSNIWNAHIGNPISPYIDFDPTTSTFSVTADKRLYESEEENVNQFWRLRLLFNDRLYELFASLPAHLINFPPIHPSSRTFTGRNATIPWYNIRFDDRGNNKSLVREYDPTTLAQASPTITKVYEVLAAHQETTSIALWNPVSSIVFASSLLPVVPTQTSVPRDVGGQHNYLSSNDNNSNLLPILSDFSVAVDATNQYRPMVEYNPGAEYRLLDLTSTANLNRIDIIVYWKDRSGGLHPFLLQPGCAASVKLMFRRQDFDVGL